MDELKKMAAKAALHHLKGYRIIGVGTGSTVNYFIEALADIKHEIEGCVASSNATEQRLKVLGIPVVELNDIVTLPLYVDGADEVTEARTMIKGGGGALTREKIIATAAETFICIVDETKRVTQLGAFPVAVEVIPMARMFVTQALINLGGTPTYRAEYMTDNGNIVLDVAGLPLNQPAQIEAAINLIPGVVENGVFGRRLADSVLMAEGAGVKQF